MASRLPLSASLALRVVPGAALVVWLLRRSDLSQLSFHWGPRVVVGVAAAFGALLLAQALSAWRWKLVLGPGSPPLRTLVRIYLVGVCFSLFLPTSVGGDAVRAVAVARRTGRPASAMSSVVLDRVLGMVALVLLLLAGLALAPAEAGGVQGVVWRPGFGAAALGALAVAGAGGALAMRMPRVRASVAEALAVWRAYWSTPATLLGGMGVALLVQLTYLGVWILLALALRLPVGPDALLLFVPLVSLAAMLPLTIAGIGIRESAWVLLLAPSNVPAASAVAFGLLYFVALVMVGAVGACLAPGGTFSARAPEPASAAPTAPIAVSHGG